jgi:hypothetical protein
MGPKLTMLLGFLMMLTGCGEAATRPPAHQAAAQPHPAAVPDREAEPPASAPETLAEADALYRSQLGASRAGQFELDRQVTELRRAMLLYQKFLDLSDGRPELEPAVKKSREALADLQATLDFLLKGQTAEARPAELAPQP